MPNPDLFDETALAKVTMLLCDSAQVADGKLFILGGGITTVTQMQPFALAVLVELGSGLTGGMHQWTLELLDDDGSPVMAGDMPVLVGGEFEVNRPPDMPADAPMVLPLALGISALPVEAGVPYVWRLAIDGTSESEWSLRFHTRTVEA